MNMKAKPNQLGTTTFAWFAIFRYCLLISISAVSSGCVTPVKSKDVSLSFISNPPGAMVYAKTTALGIAPNTIEVMVSDADQRAGYVTIQDVQAVWPSGAKSNKGPIQLPLAFGRRHTFTFSRPSDAPGLDKDLTFAAQIMQIQATNEQARAQARDTESRELQEIYKSMQPKQPTYTNCTKSNATSSVSCTTW